MLENTCKQLGLKFIGKWEEAGGFMFVINNPKLVSNETSFTVFDTSFETLSDKINDMEEQWINHKIKHGDRGCEVKCDGYKKIGMAACYSCASERRKHV
jgi:hypothetical protein